LSEHGFHQYSETWLETDLQLFLHCQFWPGLLRRCLRRPSGGACGGLLAALDRCHCDVYCRLFGVAGKGGSLPLFATVSPNLARTASNQVMPPSQFDLTPWVVSFTRRVHGIWDSQTVRHALRSVLTCLFYAPKKTPCPCHKRPAMPACLVHVFLFLARELPSIFPSPTVLRPLRPSYTVPHFPSSLPLPRLRLWRLWRKLGLHNPHLTLPVSNTPTHIRRVV